MDINLRKISLINGFLQVFQERSNIMFDLHQETEHSHDKNNTIETSNLNNNL